MAQSPNECHAVVLFSSDVAENTQNIVYSSIMESLEGQNITVDVLVIDNSNVFSAEEAIRELVVNPTESSVTDSTASGTPQMTLKSPPDILICLNATNTICAYQASTTIRSARYRFSAITIRRKSSPPWKSASFRRPSPWTQTASARPAWIRLWNMCTLTAPATLRPSA